jgi:hypothetical protein
MEEKTYIINSYDHRTRDPIPTALSLNYFYIIHILEPVKTGPLVEQSIFYEP